MTDFSSAVVTIGFDLATYAVLEDTGSVNITASILNGTLGRNVVVTLSTESGGTATGINILQPGENLKTHVLYNHFSSWDRLH